MPLSAPSWVTALLNRVARGFGCHTLLSSAVLFNVWSLSSTATGIFTVRQHITQHHYMPKPQQRECDCSGTVSYVSPRSCACDFARWQNPTAPTSTPLWSGISAFLSTLCKWVKLVVAYAVLKNRDWGLLQYASVALPSSVFQTTPCRMHCALRICSIPRCQRCVCQPIMECHQRCTA